MSDDSALRLRRKIAALLAKSDRTDNAHEAEAFAAKARALMAEHSIQEYELRQSVDPLGRTRTTMLYGTAGFRAVTDACAAYFGLRTVYYMKNWDATRGKIWPAVEFLGREGARVTAEIMVQYWWRECLRSGRAAHRSAPGQYTSAASAITEVCTAFSVRLNMLARQHPPQASLPDLPPPAEEAQAMVDAIPGLGTLRASRLSYSEHARDTAEGISVNLGVR